MRAHNVPRGDRKACLCEDGTYSRKCCKGELINQGIGHTLRRPLATPFNLQVYTDGITATLSFEVTNFERNDQYQLQIATSNTFDFLIYDELENYTNTTETITTPDVVQQRYWRVRSIRGSETTSWVLGDSF